MRGKSRKFIYMFIESYGVKEGGKVPAYYALQADVAL